MGIVSRTWPCFGRGAQQDGSLAFFDVHGVSLLLRKLLQIFLPRRQKQTISRTKLERSSLVQRLTSKLDPSLLADDGAVDVPGHADVRPGVFLLLGVVNHQVAAHQAIVFIGLLHQLDLPVIAPPSCRLWKRDVREPLLKSFFFFFGQLSLLSNLIESGTCM